MTIQELIERIKKLQAPKSKNWDNQSPQERKEFYAGAERMKADILALTQDKPTA